ncbi:MAG TPA: extracellular solute-binding protein [Casimicrobium sp.]|jgi:alpha-1,4-digalacturonate transport system substrate-binding protein|nr:extracellular solute-binding protein [Burkholderiales bacterium]HPG61109.1 extracellular solute-binding protein [Casimicrobium sp.]HPT55805.1 extracellular solute-binding protein [Casimicrobium sp.]HPV23266.1 extracellular solute-binding protein [Casimicrobium sp.]
MRIAAIAAGVALTLSTQVSAQELRVQCYSDGNECEVTADIAKRFEAANAGIKIVIDKVPYKAVVETLPVQLAAGEGPDIARVTDLGGLNKYYLDLTPHLTPARVKAWQDNFASTLPWFRAGPADKGIYGMMSQLTVTGGFVNKTLFEQAKVPMPGPTATWDDWMAASKKVADATKTPFAMAMDRTGHRFAPLAVAYGAKIFDAKGVPVIDDGYKLAAKKFVDWNKAGLMPKEVWGGIGGSAYRDAFEEFANGRIVMYYSGSWQVRRMDTQVTKSFDWTVVPAPCGPAGCTAMPGGAAYVGLKRTKSPAAVAKFLDFLSQDANYSEMMARTENIPAHLGVAKAGVTYNVSPLAKAALNSFVGDVAKILKPNFDLQGYRLNRAVFQPTAARLGQAVAGEMSTDDALKRLAADVDEQVKAASK